LKKLKISGTLAIEAILATVVVVAAVCDAVRADTGLVAAITMGIVLANLRVVDPDKQRAFVARLVLSNLRGTELPEEHPMLKTTVQLLIGLLFISISATVTPASLRGVVWPSVGLVACLVLLVRPVVAVVSTLGTSLTRNQRIFIGAMDPRGIVAASTASTFSVPLVALGLGGANRLLPVTFLVIVGTVAIYGLSATPLAKALGLRESEAKRDAEVKSELDG
jgi:NhaP-type Na+/H+ or K+/H+ antiporter